VVGGVCVNVGMGEGVIVSITTIGGGRAVKPGGSSGANWHAERTIITNKLIHSFIDLIVSNRYDP
jgi:hypothetical protein